MHDLWRDLGIGARVLWRQPGFAAFAAGTLALGVAVNAAIFSAINAVLIQPPPYGEPNRIVRLWETSASDARGVASPANWLDWAERQQVFSALAAVEYVSPTLTGVDRAEALEARAVSPDFFAVLGVRPLLGQPLRPDPDGAGGRSVVIGHGLWRRAFGGDSAIVGRDVLLDGAPRTVAGVMPPGFAFPEGVELWMPLSVSPEQRTRRTSYFLEVVARLRPGTSVEAAQAAMAGIAAQIEREHPETNRGRGVRVVGLHEDEVRGVRSQLWLLYGAVTLVLLVVCANTAGLLLARGLARSKETTVRAALGASRSRLARQFLAEALILGLLGALAGSALAAVAIELLTSWVPEDFLRLQAVRLDTVVLAYGVAAALITAAASGTLPAVRLSRIDLAHSLREGSRAVDPLGTGVRSRLGRALVAAQVAVAVLLAVGAGLLLRSLARLSHEALGFEPSGILAGAVDLPSYRYGDPALRQDFVQRLLERLTAVPGVERVAAVSDLPFSDSGNRNSLALADPGSEEQREAHAGLRIATPGYFRTLGIPVLRGRHFTADDRAGGEPVALVNAAFARRYYSASDPIGSRVRVDILGPDAWSTIVGVVGDVKHVALNEPPELEVYRPYAQIPWQGLAVVVRGPRPLALAEPLRDAVREVDPSVPVLWTSTLNRLIAQSVAEARLYASLLTLFAGLALVLVITGLYGLLSYLVSRRVREMGIRMALGARRAEVRWLVVRHGLGSAVPGVLVGLAAAFALTRVLRHALFGISPYDPPTFVGVALLLVLATAAAAYVPARRATAADPADSLRAE